jgi:hypothetical protein
MLCSGMHAQGATCGSAASSPLPSFCATLHAAYTEPRHSFDLMLVQHAHGSNSVAPLKHACRSAKIAAHATRPFGARTRTTGGPCAMPAASTSPKTICSARKCSGKRERAATQQALQQQAPRSTPAARSNLVNPVKHRLQDITCRLAVSWLAGWQGCQACLMYQLSW